MLVLILLFGAKKLHKLARSLGKSLNEFKKGQTESAPEKEAEPPAETEEPNPDA